MKWVKENHSNFYLNLGPVFEYLIVPELAPESGFKIPQIPEIPEHKMPEISEHRISTMHELTKESNHRIPSISCHPGRLWPLPQETL